MDRWELRATPSNDDPDRHLLLIRGGPSDISALLKRFGALMGRPAPARAEGFNVGLVVHRLHPEKREKLNAWLNKAAPIASQPPSPIPSIPDIAPAATPAVAAVPEEPMIPPAAPVPPLPPVPPIPIAARDELAVPVAALPVAADSPAPPAQPPISPATAYPISVGLRPEWSMESLGVGAYNRFAHAAAMSVVSAPGTMYNPLFLYGGPGTGKSHVLHAIGSSLSNGLGGNVLMVTSGARMSRAVNLALEQGDMSGILSKVKNSKALLVDDIHLTAITEANKESLAGIFKAFLEQGLQVVVTSLYPPSALGSLEEALGLSFAKGWSVDLKLPSPTIQKELIGAASDRLGAELDPDEIGMLNERLSTWGYPDLVQWMRRIAVFKIMRINSGHPAALQDLWPLIYDPLLSGGEQVAQPTRPFSAPTVGLDAPSLAVIAPKGHDGLPSEAASTFYDVGRKFGFGTHYRHALWETYDSAQLSGVPFLIGEMCARASVAKALVVGPMPDSPLGPRSAEMAHACRRILENFDIEMGWVPYNGLSLEAYYLDAHLDLAALPRKT